MLACIHEKPVDVVCPRCQVEAWTYYLSDEELEACRTRALAQVARAERLGARTYRHGERVPFSEASRRELLQNSYIGAVGEWGAAGALDLPAPDPNDVERVGKADLAPDLDVKASTNRRLIHSRGLIVNADNHARTPFRYVLAGVVLPRKVVCLGWLPPEALVPHYYRAATRSFDVPVPELEAMRDLWDDLCQAGFVKVPF